MKKVGSVLIVLALLLLQVVLVPAAHGQAAPASSVKLNRPRFDNGELTRLSEIFQSRVSDQTAFGIDLEPPVDANKARHVKGTGHILVDQLGTPFTYKGEVEPIVLADGSKAYHAALDGDLGGIHLSISYSVHGKDKLIAVIAGDASENRPVELLFGQPFPAMVDIVDHIFPSGTSGTPAQDGSLSGLISTSVATAKRGSRVRIANASDQKYVEKANVAMTQNGYKVGEVHGYSVDHVHAANATPMMVSVAAGAHSDQAALWMDSISSRSITGATVKTAYTWVIGDTKLYGTSADPESYSGPPIQGTIPLWFPYLGFQTWSWSFSPNTITVQKYSTGGDYNAASWTFDKTPNFTIDESDYSSGSYRFGFYTRYNFNYLGAIGGQTFYSVVKGQLKFAGRYYDPVTGYPGVEYATTSTFSGSVATPVQP